MGVLRRGDVALEVAQRLGVSRSQGDAAARAVLDSITAILADGDRVVITGFGAFEVREVKARSVRSIRGHRAGELVVVPAHRRVGFRPGTSLMKAVEPAWHGRLLRRARAFVEDLVGRSDDREST